MICCLQYITYPLKLSFEDISNANFSIANKFYYNGLVRNQEKMKESVMNRSLKFVIQKNSKEKIRTATTTTTVDLKQNQKIKTQINLILRYLKFWSSK